MSMEENMADGQKRNMSSKKKIKKGNRDCSAFGIIRDFKITMNK